MTKDIVACFNPPGDKTFENSCNSCTGFSFIFLESSISSLVNSPGNIFIFSSFSNPKVRFFTASFLSILWGRTHFSFTCHNHKEIYSMTFKNVEFSAPLNASQFAKTPLCVIIFNKENNCILVI